MSHPGLFKDLFKLGIVVFVLLTAAAGYAMGFEVEEDFSIYHLLIFLIGLFLLSSGSFALNQVQEHDVDRKMPRTSLRPIASGRLSVTAGLLIALLHIFSGSVLLFYLNPLTAGLGLATVVFYNVLYTMYWKRQSPFGAVPGALPGAMPVVIGYSVVNSDILATECVYLFLIMFLWQMPHFWALAIRFMSDYEKGGIPVLPLRVGKERTLYHTGLYLFLYLALALASPLFVEAKYFYLFLVLPCTLILLWQFFVFHRAKGEKGWLKFFLWANVSVLVFLLTPVGDRWFVFLSGKVSF